MPELPDITVDLEALHVRVIGQTLDRLRIVSPFLLRTVEPPVESLAGKRVQHLKRLGKATRETLKLWIDRLRTEAHMNRHPKAVFPTFRSSIRLLP